MNSFSIVTINKNNAKGLEQTIKSVREQKIKNFKKEHIIIDGGSSDSSLKIIKKNKKLFSYYQSRSDKGIYNAMNIGVKKSKMYWLIFLNSGDVFYTKNTLDDISNSICKNFDIFYGNICQKINKKKITNYSIRENLLFKNFKSNQIFHQALIIKRSINIRNRYDEKLKIFSDYKLLFNLFIKGKKFKKIDVNFSILQNDGISNQNKFLSTEEKKNFFVKKNINFYNKFLLYYEYYKYYILKKLS